MRILGLVPARGGSKGVPRKNIEPIAGASLLCRTARCAHESGVCDRIVLSTEDDEIAAAGARCNLDVPFRRPSQLALDTTAMIDVVIHALDALAAAGYEPDAVLLLQPTSPLRRADQLQAAAALLDGHDSVCSVVPLSKEHCPHYVMRIDESGRLDFFLPDGARYTRRQDVPQAYRRDGTIYLTRTEVLRGMRSFYGNTCAPLVLDPTESLTIDSQDQWREAERRLSIGPAPG